MLRIAFCWMLAATIVGYALAVWSGGEYGAIAYVVIAWWVGAVAAIVHIVVRWRRPLR